MREEEDELSLYEVQRQRNIERNRAMLQHLGLCDPISVSDQRPKAKKQPLRKKRYVLSEARHGTLRARAHNETNSTHANTNACSVDVAKAAPNRAKRAAERNASEQPPPPVLLELSAPELQNSLKAIRSTSGGNTSPSIGPPRNRHKARGLQGGWNASLTYEGTATVEGRGICKHTIAIRKRPDNSVRRQLVLSNPLPYAYPSCLVRNLRRTSWSNLACASACMGM